MVGRIENYPKLSGCLLYSGVEVRVVDDGILYIYEVDFDVVAGDGGHIIDTYTGWQ